MAVRDGREIVYVARYPARTTISSTVNIGTRFPVHATVMGRMMICDFSDAQLLDLFPTDPLPRFSDQTPPTLAELKAVLAGDREPGYARKRVGSGTVVSVRVDDGGRQCIKKKNTKI